MMAVLCFKRLAKKYRRRNAFRMNVADRSKSPNFVKITTSANEVLRLSRNGVTFVKSKDVISPIIQSINKPKMFDVRYKRDDSRKKLRLLRLLSIIGGTDATVSDSVYTIVSRHVNKHLQKTNYNYLSSAKALQRKLSLICPKNESIDVSKLFHQHFKDDELKLRKSENEMDSDDDNTNNISYNKNYNNNYNYNDNVDKKPKDEDALSQQPYLEGTPIYYGASVAIQGRHGGFMSVLNTKDVTACGHKILPTSKFMIINSDNDSSIGLVRYGDAVWLKVGGGSTIGYSSFSKVGEDVVGVLGAGYENHSLATKDHVRAIKPTLIEWDDENKFKAMQYGKWIILKQGDCINSIGDVVCHYDKILLEQEWFYLSSPSPQESAMYKTKCNIDSSEEEKRRHFDLFRPVDACTWKIHLSDAPIDASRAEQLRAVFLYKATTQIQESSEFRDSKRPCLFTPLRAKLNPQLEINAVISKEIPQKLSLKASEANLLKRYSKMALTHFERNASSKKYLESVYGPNSNIPKFKERELILRNCSKGLAVHYEAPEVVSPRVLSQLEKESDKYWTSAANILIDSKAWALLPTKMQTYYDRDKQKKLDAAKVLQRFCKKILKNRFNFGRSFTSIDKIAFKKISLGDDYDHRTEHLTNILFDNKQEPIPAPEKNKTVNKSNTFLTTGSIISDNVSVNDKKSFISRSSRDDNSIQKNYSDRKEKIAQIYSNMAPSSYLLPYNSRTSAITVHNNNNSIDQRPYSVNNSLSASDIKLINTESLVTASIDKSVTFQFNDIIDNNTQLERSKTAPTQIGSNSSLFASTMSTVGLHTAGQKSTTSQKTALKIKADENRERLNKTDERSHGLPDFVFEKQQKEKLSVDTGMKFLLAMKKKEKNSNAKSNIYGDIAVKKRKDKFESHHMRKLFF
jgi:hypothetical protein